tara:strand:+ start:872 stop:1087 length:216 start_codon:yes stop_codon:yes gene_type:complete
MIEKIDNDVIMNIYNEVLEDVLSEVESEDLIVSSRFEARDIAIERATKYAAQHIKRILNRNAPTDFQMPEQ